MTVAEREQTLEQLLKEHDIVLERYRQTGAIKVSLGWNHPHDKSSRWFTDTPMTDGEYTKNEDLNKMRSRGQRVRAIFGGSYVVVLRNFKHGRRVMRVVVRDGNTNEIELVRQLENIFAHGYAH
jgi:hypothetical protein